MKSSLGTGLASVFVIMLLAGFESNAEVSHASTEAVALAKEFREFRSPVFTSRKSRSVRSANGVPDYAALTQDQKAGLRDFQTRLRALNPQGWPVHDQIDYLLLRAEMDDVDWQHQVLREPEKNPYFYVEQALDGIKDAIGTYRSAALVPYSVENADAIIAAFARTAPIVEQGPKTLVLTDAAPEFAHIALRELNEIEEKYAAGAELFAAHMPKNRRGRLTKAAADAGAALETYRRWIERNLSRMKGQPHVGRDNLNWLLKRIYFIPWSYDELLLMAGIEEDRFVMMIEIEERKNRGLKPLTMPTSAEWVEWFRLTYLQTKYFLKDLDLISFHPYIGETYIEEGAVWQEPFGDGQHTGAIAFPTEPVKRHGRRMFVLPEDHWFTRTYFERLMRVDPITDFHHSEWPGHFFEAQVTSRNPCPVRAGHKDSGFSNWAHYLEELFLNFDYPFLRGPRTRELHWNLLYFRALRVPLDLELSSGTRSIEESIQWQIDSVPFMEEQVARTEVEGYVRRPFSAASYLVGKKQIEEILSDRVKQLGGPGGHAALGEPQQSRFDWREFHDTLLASGQIPLALVRWEMTGHEDQIRNMRVWAMPDLAQELSTR